MQWKKGQGTQRESEWDGHAMRDGGETREEDSVEREGERNGDGKWGRGEHGREEQWGRGKAGGKSNGTGWRKSLE